MGLSRRENKAIKNHLQKTIKPHEMQQMQLFNKCTVL